MRLLQKFLSKPTQAIGIVAISIMPNGFSIAITRYLGVSRPRLIHCEFVSAHVGPIFDKLSKLANDFQLADYDCHIVLSPEQYRSISIEEPQVNSEEIKQALRWRIADFLDYSVDEAVLDFYPLPRSNRPNTPKMLETIACPQQTVVGLVQQCRQVGLNIKVIDIQETSLRNLATLLRESQQGIAVIHLQRDEGRIIIQKNGEIYLSRKIATGYMHLDETSPHNDLDRILQEQDALALDIQRSFDYVENYFDIPPINTLATLLMPINTQNTVNFLNIRHGISTYALDVSAVVDADLLLSDETQNLCAPVIGASLRRLVDEVVPL